MKGQVLNFSPFHLIVGLPCSTQDVNTEDVINNLTKRTFWPFNNPEQWELGRRLLFPKPKSQADVEHFAVEKNCLWFKQGTGFESYNDFKNRVQELGESRQIWSSMYVRPTEEAPSWAPCSVEFWMRNSLDVLREMVADVRLGKDMKWAPEKLFNERNERLYTDLFSGDWWWETQVYMVI